MLALQRPSPERLAKILSHLPSVGFNHSAVGTDLLRETAPGFVLDEYGADLGEGAATFDAALGALEAFGMYPRAWTDVHCEVSPMTLGAEFIAVTRQLGFYGLLPCRVIEVENNSAPGERVRSFAFGTLRGHVEAGVERFRVRWDLGTDAVRLDVRAVSRPVGITRLGSPIARRIQLRFHRQAGPAFLAAMGRTDV